MTSIEAAPSSSGEYESKPFLSYEEYRQLCEESQPDVVRKTGIPDPEDYEAAKADERTIYAEINNQRVPLFTPLECVSGFNSESSRRLTESDDVFVLSLPFEAIIGNELDIAPYLAKLGENAAVIAETSSIRTSDIQAEVSRLVPEGGVCEFIDPRLRGERQKASISLYMAYMDALDENGNLIPMQDKSLYEAFLEDKAATGNEDVELVEASQIRNDEGLVDKTWDLHNDKLEWLGEYHPVSMQENKNFFMQIHSNDCTESIVRFEEDATGNRAALGHGTVMEGTDQIVWLTNRFQKQMQEGLDPERERIQFFYGIAGKSGEIKMAHVSKDIIAVDARLLKLRGGRTIVMFESTNMSSGYIPRMIGQYSADEPNGVKLAGDIQTVAKLDYWYFKPQVQDQEQSYNDVAA